MILVADNSQNNNYVTRMALEVHDYDCLPVYNWFDLKVYLYKCRKNLECIILDCDLPGGDCYREVEKAISDIPGINIILTGCYPGNKFALNAREKQQVHAYMVKPFSIWDLVSVVDNISCGYFTKN